MFLVPLDRQRQWYRYHALFREFLLAELRRVEPDVIVKLHLRAADWYESNGSPALALEHLLNTTERNRCVQLAAALILPVYQSGQQLTVQRRLGTLGHSAVEDYPPLAVLAGWFAVLTGQTAEAQRWAAFVDTASFDLLPVDGTASFDSARAMLRALMCAAGPTRDGDRREFGRRGRTALEPMARCGTVLACRGATPPRRPRGRGALFRGDVRGGDELGKSPRSSSATPSSRCWRWIAADGPRRPSIWTLRSPPPMLRLHDYSLSVLAFAAAARLAVHHGDRKEVDRQLARAMRARPLCTFAIPWVAVRVRLQLAKVYATLADHGTARHLLLEIDDILLHRPALGALIDEVTAFRAILSSGAPKSIGAGPPLTPAELRLLPYMQTISRSVRSGSGSSCPVTPSAPRSARSTENLASPRAATRCNRRRRSACSAGSAAATLPLAVTRTARY